MAYLTADQYAELYGEPELIQLTDRTDPPSGQADDDVFSSALAQATRQIDAALVSGGVSLPIGPGNASALAIITALALPITRYHLHQGAWTDKVLKDYEIAIATLRDIATGKVVIPDEDGENLSTAGPVVKQYEASTAATFGESFNSAFLP